MLALSLVGIGLCWIRSHGPGRVLAHVSFSWGMGAMLWCGALLFFFWIAWIGSVVLALSLVGVGLCWIPLVPATRARVSTGV